MTKQLQPWVSFETLGGHWSSAARRLGWKGMSSSTAFVPVWEMPVDMSANAWWHFSYTCSHTQFTRLLGPAHDHSTITETHWGWSLLITSCSRQHGCNKVKTDMNSLTYQMATQGTRQLVGWHLLVLLKVGFVSHLKEQLEDADTQL